jgi:hypothetical protein
MRIKRKKQASTVISGIVSKIIFVHLLNSELATIGMRARRGRLHRTGLLEGDGSTSDEVIIVTKSNVMHPHKIILVFSNLVFAEEEVDIQLHIPPSFENIFEKQAPKTWSSSESLFLEFLFVILNSLLSIPSPNMSAIPIAYRDSAESAT